jgi:hypothetical protein
MLPAASRRSGLARGLDTQKSTFGYILMLNEAAVSWRREVGAANVSQYLPCSVLKLSSLQRAQWFRKSSSFAIFLDNLGFNLKQKSRTPFLADIETCIHWSEGSVVGSEIVQSTLISASTLFMMRVSMAFCSFRRFILSLMVQIS